MDKTYGEWKRESKNEVYFGKEGYLFSSRMRPLLVAIDTYARCKPVHFGRWTQILQ